MSYLWLSHSRIRDFQVCPRAYFLNHVFIEPKRRRKVQLMTPALALGSVVHRVLESLSTLPVKERFKTSLVAKLEEDWLVVKGEHGGFSSPHQEKEYLDRGRSMMQKVMSNPGPLAELAVKIPSDLPSCILSTEDDIKLCGKIDWLQYHQADNTISIIDFKTSRREEPPDSLQLPIYYVLATKTQDRQVVGVSYWYLENDTQPSSQSLPDFEQTWQELKTIGKQIATAHKLNRFKCLQGEKGCRACSSLEKIVTGEAKWVGEGEYGKDIYILPEKEEEVMTGVVL